MLSSVCFSEEAIIDQLGEPETLVVDVPVDGAGSTNSLTASMTLLSTLEALAKPSAATIVRAGATSEIAAAAA